MNDREKESFQIVFRFYEKWREQIIETDEQWNAFAEDVRAAREAGMDGHIAKPIDTTEMMRTLCGILHNKP